MQTGIPFHGEFSSADASALTESNARFALYGAQSTTALTLDANDVVVITDIVLSMTGSTARTVEIYDGADATVGAGEQVTQAALAENANLHVALNTPHQCQKGTYPKLKAGGAGQIDATLHGVIYRKGA